MRRFLFFLTFIVLSFFLKAQTAEDSIKATINKLFVAMKKSDAILLKTAFADSAILQSIVRNKVGQMEVKNETVEEFANSISRLQKGDGDERIKFDAIKIDGPLAAVWAPYNFFYKGAFSHCGVDSFQLIRINGEWKIQYLIDTRRKNGCE